jgi:CRISPR-associated protein Cmr4
MFKSAKPLFLIVETSLHAGSGSDLGIVDLPIQREKHTNYPKIEASGIKGGIREVLSTQPNLVQLGLDLNITAVEDDKYKKAIDLAFGPEQGDLHAGALGFTDARLLLFPVKSVKGVFAWVTCPAVLERFKHDLSICEPCTSIGFVEDIPDANTVTSNSGLIVKDEENDKKIVLEEYTFTVKSNNECDAVAEWIAENVLPSDDPSYDYWRDKVKRDLVVLSDDDFRDFVMLSTEVIARTKIDSKTGTVATGALWYEEYLPTDSILYSLALTTPLFLKIEGENDEQKQADEKEKKGSFYADQETDKNRIEAEKVMKFFADGLPSIIQIGGNATVGKGIVRTHVYQQGGENDATKCDNS